MPAYDPNYSPTRSTKPLRSHMVSQIAVAKAQDEQIGQKFQG